MALAGSFTMDMTMDERLQHAVPFYTSSALNHSFPGAGSGGQSLPPHPYLEPLEFFEQEMTQLHQRFGDGDEDPSLLWPTAGGAAPAHSPNDTLSSHSDEVAKSPGPGKHTSHGSLMVAPGGSCQSMSPSAASMILTPTSSNALDYHDGSAYGDHDSDNNGTSPGSGVVNSPMDDFAHISDSELGGGKARRMTHQPPPSGARPSLAVHTSRRSRESSASQHSSNQAVQGQHWMPNSFDSSPAMDDTYMPYSTSADLVYSTDAFADDDQHSAHLDGLDGTSPMPGQPYGHLPFRPHENLSPHQMSAAYANQVMMSQQQMFRQPATGYLDQTFNQSFNNSQAFQPMSQYQNNMNAAGFGYNAPQMNQRAIAQYMQQSQRRANMQANLAMQSTRNNMASMQAQQYRHQQSQQSQQSQQQQQQHSQQPQQSHQQQSSNMRSMSPPDEKIMVAQSRRSISQHPSHEGSSTATAVTRRPIQRADRAPPGALVTQAPSGVRKGGRSKGGHLPEASRAKSHSMRKIGACWRCAMQRDPCDEGTPCTRCIVQMQRGQLNYFPCDRSKLPDFVHDFLPPQASMTLMHQKQSIEDTVSEQVVSWDKDNGIDVYLSSGYGPPLVWRLYEFKPKTDQLLSQLQFWQDTKTRQLKSRFKYSPPFGLLRIDTSDDTHFDTYLDSLLEPENLWDFGWSYYEEESIVDDQMFQARLLDAMCKLYLHTADPSLKSLLKDILRMMIITFIMGHTLTIVEGTLPTVISHIRHSQRPTTFLKHTSPRLANRQLKFFFAVSRNQIYEKILKWQQATLHTAGKKDQTWLQAFCVMLGLAMVLEEVQRTIHIQGDASAQRREMTPESAENQARNACERIDSRFNLLIGLFQCKYRDKRWGDNGSFGPGTPEMKEGVQADFLSELRRLVEQRWQHLRDRESVTFSKENQCLYTTRLTARFLLPFLNLP